MKLWLKILLISLGSLAVIGGIYGLSGLTLIDKHEYGFVFDRTNGTINPVGRTGWIWREPITHDAHKIDLRPYQLRITANVNLGERILNAKLCRFNPEGIETFIAWHGRKAGNDVNSLKEILKCYAFAPDGGASCPFLIVDSEIAPAQTETKEVEKHESTFEQNQGDN